MGGGGRSQPVGLLFCVIVFAFIFAYHDVLHIQFLTHPGRQVASLEAWTDTYSQTEVFCKGQGTRQQQIVCLKVP